MKHAIYLMILAIFAFSCSKEEGEGGNSVITGKVLTKAYNNTFTQVIDSFYKPDVDVFLVYGDNTVYNDDFKTNWDGSYRFEYLRKGNYKVFAYSIDPTGESESGVYPVFADIKIDGNNDVVQVNDIVVLETMDYNEGTSSITGKVYVLDYNAERTSLLAQYFGADEDVFIVYGYDPFYFDDVKTHHDGTFRFENLVKGTYTVYALSDPIGRQLIPVSQTVTIDRDFQHIVLTDSLVIIK